MKTSFCWYKYSYTYFFSPLYLEKVPPKTFSLDVLWRSILPTKPWARSTAWVQGRKFPSRSCGEQGSNRVVSLKHFLKTKTHDYLDQLPWYFNNTLHFNSSALQNTSQICQVRFLSLKKGLKNKTSVLFLSRAANERIKATRCERSENLQGKERKMPSQKTIPQV